MNRAVVVKIFGDQDIGKAIADGIDTRLTKDQMTTVQSEIRAQKLREARLGVMEARVNQTTTENIAKARMAYRPLPEPLGMRRTILLVWAILWLGIDTAYRRLAAINRAS